MRKMEERTKIAVHVLEKTTFPNSRYTQAFTFTAVILIFILFLSLYTQVIDFYTDKKIYRRTAISKVLLARSLQ